MGAKVLATGYCHFSMLSDQQLGQIALVTILGAFLYYSVWVLLLVGCVGGACFMMI